MKTIAVASAIFILLTTSSFTMSSKSQLEQSQNQSQVRINQQDQLKVDQNEGRDFSVLSFNKDGTELMFNECFDAKLINKNIKENANGNENECRIFRLNLASNTLRHYELPDQDKYIYQDATFSPKANYVVMKRIPKPTISEEEQKKLTADERQKLITDIFDQSEIVFMKSDGTDLKIIKIEQEGVIARPIMSNDETKIAYFKAKLRKPGSKSFAAQFDIYEIDLKNKTDKLFAGPYEFFETGNMQYLKGDKEILVHAYVPLNDEARGGLSTGKYTDKYSNSSIYKISRGAEGLLEPMVMEGFTNIRDPFSGTSGSIYFYGQEVKTGMQLSKKNIRGNISKWEPTLEHAYIRQIIVNSDESKIFFCYTFFEPNRFKRTNIHKSGIAYLNTKTSEWKKLEVPLVNSSKEIKVTNSGFIEIKQPDEQNRSLKKLPNFTLTNPLNSKK